MSPVRLWLLGVAAMVGGFFLVASIDIPTPESHWPLFVFTVVVTLLCAVFAKVLVAIGVAVKQPDLAILGAGLFASSMFPFVHGMTIPGVLIAEEAHVTSFGAWFGLPAALLISLPSLSQSVPWARWAQRHWKLYCGVCVMVVYASTLYLLLRPNGVPAASPHAWWTVVGAGAAFTGAQILAYQQIKLFEVGRRAASVGAAVGFSWLGSSSLLWFLDAPNGSVVWAAHLLDGFGVLAAAGGLMLSHRNNRDLTTVLAPVLTRDPAVALRLGVTPQIADFIAMLDEKDRTTAGHVTRVAELAMRLGEGSGLRGEELRNLGLGALLHDIGKVRVSDEILTKPGKLTDDEFDQMKQHTVWGHEMLAADPLLAPVGLLVRAHHERMDGRGYPDGLRGDRIPLAAQLISVTDAWDAMVQTRHYREGMSDEKARSILIEHAGSQWSTEAVEALLHMLDSDVDLSGVFADLADSHGEVCTDAIADLGLGNDGLVDSDR